ncbi:DUF3298 and DUF4163 domain-containing protein [Microbulbifer celer]|uniref:DUF3298 domain-containing protein n=1 Tax=Microbulbifer celer TaxID=435905 RepID=A0ABW3UCI6_9GAMM|nr:DUF3298 and DUF4163 domain-containing protein [Microbulbifer celer]UFN57357.1 DUF3298 and DUF4163 domain-containing protein [Microbulbifer celer]
MNRWCKKRHCVARLASGMAFLGLLTLNGCDRPGASSEAPLSSEIEAREWRAPNCVAKDKCSTVSIKREVFADRPALNGAVEQQLREQLQGNGESAAAGSDDSIEQVAKAFIAEAGKVAGMSSAPWELIGEAKSLGRRGNLLTVAINSYLYSGGAHGMPVTHWLNWDLAKASQVVLADLIKPGADQKFWSLAQQQHEKWLDAQNADADFRENWPFARTDDFRLTDNGLVLLYGVYTLGPYAMGDVELTLPREKLADVLHEHY